MVRQDDPSSRLYASEVALDTPTHFRCVQQQLIEPPDSVVIDSSGDHDDSRIEDGPPTSMPI